MATLAAVAATLFAGALALRRTRPVAVRRRADGTLAAASPAVLGASPQRRFYAGRNLARAVTIEDLRAMAHRRLPAFALEYLEGGGEEEASLARNLAALAQWRFTHRAIADVSHVETGASLFGRPLAMPVLVAPTGLNALFWPHADLRLAEAAAASGVPCAQSTMSNDDMAAVARVPGLRYWWQLYLFGPEEVRDRLIERADAAQCEALVVTVDAQIYGNREWEKRARSGAASLGAAAAFDALAHPRWLGRGILSHGMPRFANVIQFVPRERRGFFDSAMWIRSQMDRALSWDKLRRIRDRWPRRLVIKGLLSLDEIARAAEIGADAVAISNHGGRQLDWAVAPLDLLPQARREVGRRIALFVDGGFRRGSDIVKALALGADAVFVGRAPLYGVAAAGREGAKRALDILREELERDLGLLGVARIDGLDQSLLHRAG